MSGSPDIEYLLALAEEAQLRTGTRRSPNNFQFVTVT